MTATADRVRSVLDTDLPQLVAWRNHDAVRRFMFDPRQVDLDKTRAWFARQSEDPRVSLLMFECEGVPSGYVRFQLAEDSGVADWGFYRAPEAAPGTGLRLGRVALAHAFGPMAAHKVCGQVLEFNVASIRFHERLGFTHEGTLREQHFDGERRHDVVCFGLLAREWSTDAYD